MSYAPFPLVWGFFGSGGGGGGGPAFGVIQTDFGTYPTASGTSDVLTLVSADSARYYFTGTALTDTVTLTVNGLIPPGGSYGQILAKASGTNFDTEWRDGVQVTSVYNNSGSTISKGSVVYINGAQGNLPTIALSQANAESTSSKTYGLVVADISNMSSGSVVASGQIRNLNTFGVTEGVTLWLSPSVAGGYTTTKPTAPNNTVAVGVCTRAHPTQGTIEVKIQNGYELEELHNVSITSPSNGQVLSYDSSTSLWKNASVSGSGTVTSVSVVSANGLAGTVANSTTTPAITLSTSVTGVLKGNGTAISAAVSGTDYEPALTKGNLTELTSAVLTITGGTNAIIGSGTTIQVKQASGSQSGYLSSTDWTTFNSKEPALTKGNLTESTSSVLTITGGSNAVIGSGTSIQVKKSSASQDGYLSSTDWSTFNNKQDAITGGASSITSTNLTASKALVSDVSGKVSASATTSTELGYISGVTSAIQTQINSKEPTLTKGNLTESTSSVLTVTGGSNAVIGSGTSIQVKQSSGSQSGYLSSTDWSTFNGKPSITSSTPLSVNSSNSVGTATDAARSDHTHKGVASFAKNGSSQLSGDVTISAGSNITLTQVGNDIAIASTASGGAGTVTNVSVVSANGLAGSVANATTTPAITLSTSITGVLKGNGTAISAAVSGTDYEPPVTKGNLTESTSSVLTITGGSNAVIGSGTSIQVKAADTTQAGTLSALEYRSFLYKDSPSDLDYSAFVRFGSSTINNINNQTNSVSGSQVAVSALATTAVIHKIPHINHNTTSTAGTNCGYRIGGTLTYTLPFIAGGFKFSHVFQINDATTLSQSRNFVGFNTSSSAIAINTTTNTDPFRATFTNFFGIGHDSFFGDTNLKLFNNGSTAGSTTVYDLGSGFSIAQQADTYIVTFYNATNSTDVYWEIYGYISGNRASGVMTSNLPTGVGLYAHTTRSNGGNAAVATLKTGSMHLLIGS